MLQASWAYDFACDQPLEAVVAAFNATGPWHWELRESGAYGDYLHCRPVQGVRLRVHEYPQTGAYGTFVGLRDQGFTVLLEIEEESVATRMEIDDAMQGLLQAIDAAHTTEIEPYD